MARHGRCSSSLGGIALWRRGFTLRDAIRTTADLAIYPVLAIVMFFFHSWFTTGAWFVTGGFYVPDNVATGNVWKAFMAVVYGMRLLIGTPLILLAVAGVLLVLARSRTATRGCRATRRRRSRRVHGAAGVRVLQRSPVPHALHRRALGGCGCFRRHRAGHAQRPVARRGGGGDGRVAHRGEQAAERPRADGRRKHSGMCPSAAARQNVTACLARDYHGERILASMGSLAHYMQELSHAGINIRDFVHEGTLPYWQEAIEAPQGRVGWILIEERAEGGDVLAARARDSSAFHTGSRACARMAAWRSIRLRN